MKQASHIRSLYETSIYFEVVSISGTRKIIVQDRMSQLETMKKTRILFICTQNAGRSQMAEGYLRTRYGDRYEVFSAGTDPTAVSRKAISVMKEIGIDISGHRSKSLSEFDESYIDLAVTLCNNASTVCSVFPWAEKTLHHAFADPGALTGSEEDIMHGVRGIRDEIVSWIDTCFGSPETVDADSVTNVSSS
jgi:arsenate reductase